MPCALGAHAGFRVQSRVIDFEVPVLFPFGVSAQVIRVSTLELQKASTTRGGSDDRGFTPKIGRCLHCNLRKKAPLLNRNDTNLAFEPTDGSARFFAVSKSGDLQSSHDAGVVNLVGCFMRRGESLRSLKVTTQRHRRHARASCAGATATRDPSDSLEGREKGTDCLKTCRPFSAVVMLSDSSEGCVCVL